MILPSVAVPVRGLRSADADLYDIFDDGVDGVGGITSFAPAGPFTPHALASSGLRGAAGTCKTAFVEASALASDAVGAALALHRARLRVRLAARTGTASRPPPPDVLDAAAEAFTAQILTLGTADEKAPADGCCLESVCRSQDTVYGSDFVTVEPYDADKLNVVSDTHSAVDLAPLLDPASRALLENFDQ